jgi:hypothetical protein
MKRTILFLLGALLLASVPTQAATFTVMPPTGVSGYPGRTVTWDFTIQNDTDYWVLLTSSEFSAGDPIGVFENFALTWDFIAPHTSPTGVARFAINAGATPGTFVTGPIIVYYFEYDVDPATWDLLPEPPDPLPYTEEPSASALATVTVLDLPEPRTLALLAGALGLRLWKKT